MQPPSDWGDMRLTPALLAALLFAPLLAGCASKTTDLPDVTAGQAGSTARLAETLKPIFSKAALIDTVRAGGEPVIAVTPKGTILVSAHPGFTHYHPSSDPAHAPVEIAQDYGGQVYLFRSTDQGTSWNPIGLPMTPGGLGPRSGGLGVSDPDFTVMADGTICYTDLEALAAASVSCSTDDGLTWGAGNAAASGGPIDRQWLASYKDELYFTGNYFASQADFRASTDHGLTWEDRGQTPCNGDMVVQATTGHIFQDCSGVGITVSQDGGRTWSSIRYAQKGLSQSGLIIQEPAIDAAGNVWVAWSSSERDLHLAGTADEGLNWTVLDLTASFRQFTVDQVAAANGTVLAPHGGTNGTYVWPWVSAGSEGRVSVSWIGSYDTKPSEQYDGAWYIFSAFVLDAKSAQPKVAVTQVTQNPMHVGPICQQGTLCQVASMQGDPAGDRRLGDFFETTIDPKTGDLLLTFSDTATRPNDVVGHPTFARQTGGLRLVSDADLGTVLPTQG